MDKDFKRLTDFLIGMASSRFRTPTVLLGAPDRPSSVPWKPRADRRTSAERGCSTRSTAPSGSRVHLAPGAPRRGPRPVGDRAERLAYLNCAMDRESFDRALDQVTSPIGSRTASPAKRSRSCGNDFDDLCRVTPHGMAGTGTPFAGVGLSPDRLPEDGRAIGWASGRELSANLERR